MPSTNGGGSESMVIIVDEEAAAFLDQQGITDPNAYINQLLQKEMERQQKAGCALHEPGGQNLDDLLRSTPDASGYPEMTGHFRDETR